MEPEVWQVANEGRESGEGGKPHPGGEIRATERYKYLMCAQMILLAPPKVHISSRNPTYAGNTLHVQRREAECETEKRGSESEVWRKVMGRV